MRKMSYKIVACDNCSYKQHKNKYFITQSKGTFRCPFCNKAFNFKVKVPPRVFFETDIGREATIVVAKLNGRI